MNKKCWLLKKTCSSQFDQREIIWKYIFAQSIPHSGTIVNVFVDAEGVLQMGDYLFLSISDLWWLLSIYLLVAFVVAAHKIDHAAGKKSSSELNVNVCLFLIWKIYFCLPGGVFFLTVSQRITHYCVFKTSMNH